MKALQNPIVGSTVGGLLFLGVSMTMVVQGYRPPAAGPAHNPMVEHHVKAAEKAPTPSWAYHNPEVEQLIIELKNQKSQLTSRERELQELASRLAAERAELTTVTHSVAQMRLDIEKDIVRIRDDETGNLKRLAKVYATMDPAAAAQVFKEMDETTLTKVMTVMKDAEVSPVLDALARLGETGARRAAALSERLRIISPIPPKRTK
jgi:flagellar motility protein MotE (MotC chaperone)